MGALVGISPDLDADGRWRRGRRTQYLDTAYAGALREAGATPIYLPHEADVDELAQRIDALLLPGGDDFPPPTPYPPEVEFTPAAPEKIVFDAALLARALARDIPVLGICYGMQLLAHARGGALLYHVPRDLPEAQEHQLGAPEARHEIQIASGTRLASILGARAKVNSRHHQGVATPGEGLAACAHSADGLIEAIEAPAARFVLGVQWHPEILGTGHRELLFGAFVAACSRG